MYTKIFFTNRSKSFPLKLLTTLILIAMVTGILPGAVLLTAYASIEDGSSTAVEDTYNNTEAVRNLAKTLCYVNEPNVRRGMFTWDSERKNRSWTYYNGIMMDAFLMLGEEDSFIEYVNQFYDANVAEDGKVDSTGSSQNYYRENELDSIPPTRALFDLLRSSSGTITDEDKAKYRKMIDYVYSIMLSYEVVENANGNFIHKMNNGNWATYQIALDGLYMAQPFFMEIANALEDGTLISEDFDVYSYGTPDSTELYNSVIDRMRWIGNEFYDGETGLYNHGWGPEAGMNGQFWLRGVGWYAAALADVISMLPDGEFGFAKEELIDIEKRLFDGMMSYQDEETGMWYNVINYDGTLQGLVSNNLESSGSALLAYAMMKSYTEGYVDATYGEAGLRAFNGTVMNCLVEEGLINVYKSSGVADTPEGYLTNTYETNEAKGVGPLMMAASYAVGAAEKLAEELETPPVEPETPSFKTYSLVLGGKIGINFYMDLPRIEGVDYGSSYMEFTVSGKDGFTKDVPFDEEKKNTTGDYYRFTCYVNSIQMADDITAVFHYRENNEEKQIAKTCTVEEYLRVLSTSDGVLEEAKVLAKATADYGYYVQPYLANVNHWDLEGETPAHKRMEFHSRTGYTDSIEEILTGIGAGPSVEKTSDIKSLSISLRLESDTTLNLLIYTDTNYAGTVTATVDDKDAEVTKIRNGKYQIVVPNIGPKDLDNKFSFAVNTDAGKTTIKVSALDYLKIALSNPDAADDEIQAMGAIYYYYEAAKAYVEAQGNA